MGHGVSRDEVVNGNAMRVGQGGAGLHLTTKLDDPEVEGMMFVT